METWANLKDAKMTESQTLSPIRSADERAAAFGDRRLSISSYQIPAGGDPFGSLLQPECLLPTQYNGLVRKRPPEAGERRLLLAVLKDALRTYLKSMDGRTANARRDFEETGFWFYAPNQEGLFAYEHLCETLGIHPEPLRQWLRSLHDDGGRPRGRRIWRNSVHQADQV